VNRTTVARVLAVIVASLSISVLFWPNSAPEEAAATTTTLLVNSSVPWVDRTTPVNDEFEPSEWERRVAVLEEWVVENRGLQFISPPRLEFQDQDSVLELSESIYAAIDLSSYDLATPLFGPQDASSGIDWSVLYLHAPLVIQTELTEIVTSEYLIPRLVAELTEQHHGYREDLVRLLESGLVGDQYEALATLVIGDAFFVGSGYGFYLATGIDWEPDSGCMQAFLVLFRSAFDAGTAYVCSLYAEGGWEAVDAAYADPPESTAEILGIACEPPADAAMTPLPRWPVLFYAQRGPIWFNATLGPTLGDISSISGWCADHQRVVGTDSARILIMDIWLGTPDDAEIIETETIDHFLTMEDPDLDALVVRDGTWVGIAVTRSDVDLCAELPGWC
jgi:hypothetical protein